MKALILAAGFGTRLEKEIEAYSGPFQSEIISWVKGKPKGLVLIKGESAISIILSQLEKAGVENKNIYLQTNAKYYPEFVSWIKKNKVGIPNDNIINNRVEDNEHRLGTIGDLKYALETKIGYQEPLLVLAQDALIFDINSNPYNLGNLVRNYRQDGYSRIVVYPGEKSRLSKHGLVATDSQGFITAFQEKPKPPVEPISSLINASVHLYSPECLALIQEYPGEMDHHGHLIAYLFSRVPIKTERVAGRQDLGNLNDILKANGLSENI